ncbi:MAG: tyrosine--tRNA ligase [Oscillospiraceae bacterium]|jgi:tyrosyl-tRNA synthetase|nr:tyrosine--tRNA ligase [Oscillospiraceae bacterium]MCI2036229.1 tyrosine--tRNA ligase [Oscillospiraceae bacterium]
MGVYEELKERGLVAQVTDEERVRDLLNNRKTTFYIGFDPTADSLHVGHFIPILVASHLQRAGHTPIMLFGGGTGMVGDPTGKTEMRRMLTKEEIAHNISCFQKQMSRLIDFSGDRAIMANNADWLSNLNYIDFLREIGVCFSVNRMLAAECYKQRLERGLSFFEMNYMVMQSYDFLELYRRFGCRLELGGDDQWSNILGGVELIRRKENGEAFGLTVSLLTNSEGKKMGKTEKGAVWLDPEKTSPFDFYQYWRNVDDADVVRCLKVLTFVPLKQIAEFAGLEGRQLNGAKELLAYEITKEIHGRAEAEKARDAARSIFGRGAGTENMPSSEISESDFADGKVGIPDLLVRAKLAPSKSEARRLVAQGGVAVDGKKAEASGAALTAADFRKPDGTYVVLRKGKKVYHKVILTH